jgi:hypothetical protein
MSRFVTALAGIGRREGGEYPANSNPEMTTNPSQHPLMKLDTKPPSTPFLPHDQKIYLALAVINLQGKTCVSHEGKRQLIISYQFSILQAQFLESSASNKLDF